MQPLDYSFELTPNEAVIRRLSNGCGTWADMSTIAFDVNSRYASKVPESLRKRIFLEENYSLFSDVTDDEGTSLKYIEKQVLALYSHLARAQNCGSQLATQGKKATIAKIYLDTMADGLTQANKLLIKLTGKRYPVERAIENFRQLYTPITM